MCKLLGGGLAALGVLAATSALADAPAELPPASETPPRVEQTMEDAWWTGPMLAAGAGSLPKGHWLVEPYLFDIKTKGSDTLGSLTYVLYGLNDRVTVGAIPTFFHTEVDGGRDTSGVEVGDLQAQAQLGLTKFRKGSWVPTSSVVIQQTLPIGKHDRLEDRPGFGGGVYSTTLGYYTQTYWWTPSGRIARFRLNTTATMSGATDVRDDSVYGTPVGFRGRAKPGASWLVNGAVEYSVTSNWVLALDLVYTHAEPTKVSGVGAAGELIRYDTGVHDSFAVAPAVEYNFSPTVGVLAGLRVIPPAGGRRSSVTPAVALNWVY